MYWQNTALGALNIKTEIFLLILLGSVKIFTVKVLYNLVRSVLSGLEIEKLHVHLLKTTLFIQTRHSCSVPYV